MMFANDRDRRCGLRVTVKLHNYIANLDCLFAYYFRFTTTVVVPPFMFDFATIDALCSL